MNMKNFIELTTINNEKIVINTDYIVEIMKDVKGTRITYLSSSDHHTLYRLVNEPFDSVKKMVITLP